MQWVLLYINRWQEEPGVGDIVPVRTNILMGWRQRAVEYCLARVTSGILT